MDSCQKVWDRLNCKLSNLCSDGVISEEKMEQILDECQLMSPDQLADYWNENWNEDQECEY